MTLDVVLMAPFLASSLESVAGWDGVGGVMSNNRKFGAQILVGVRKLRCFCLVS